jgi:hypothetical protein
VSHLPVERKNFPLVLLAPYFIDGKIVLNKRKLCARFGTLLKPCRAPSKKSRQQGREKE